MIGTWLLWRGLKLALVGLFVGGVLATVTAETPTTRRRLAHGLVTLSFLGTWISGYALLKLAGHSLGAPWVLASMGASLFALHGALATAHRGPTRTRAALALGGALASVAVMVVRADALPDLPLPLATGGLAGAALAITLTRPAPGDDDTTAIWTWFTWVARAEGVTLLLLTVVGMPLRAAGVHLDGGTGLIGWTHGALVFVYLEALAAAAVSLGWGPATVAEGFLLSLLPFGTFAFERRRVRARAA